MESAERMRGMQRLESLAEIIGCTVTDLREIAEFADDDVNELIAYNPASPEKPRPVISVNGRLRLVQDRIYNERMLRELKPSFLSHGGVAGRDIKSNVAVHAGNRFGFKVDISAFYPSISCERVYDLFHRGLRCSHEVTRFLTRFCTYDHHLALGLVTSPILADQILKSADERLAKLCDYYNLRVTRYVDDIMISGAYDIRDSVVPDRIHRILTQEGFRSNPEKCCGGRLDGDFTITGLCLKNGRIDIAQKYLHELERLIADHQSLAADGPFEGPYLSEGQLAGKVNHVCWVNPRRAFALRRRFNSIRWDLAEVHAKARGRLRERKMLKGRDEPPPAYVLRYREGVLLG